MNMEQQIERARSLYYESLELSSRLGELDFKYFLKDERYQRVSRIYRKADERVSRRMERLFELNNAYLDQLGQQIASAKAVISSLDSAGLAQSLAQPTDAVVQEATSETGVYQQAVTSEQIEPFFHQVQNAMLALPSFNDIDQYPDFKKLITDAFDSLVSAEHYLIAQKSTGLALSLAQLVEAVGQGASYECSVCLDTGHVWDNDEYTNVPCRDCGAWFEIGVPQ